MSDSTTPQDDMAMSPASTGSVADVSQFANRESDRPQPINAARMAALEQLSAADQELELQYGFTGNPMIKAREHTPQTQPTPGDGTSQSECTEPVAWLVEGCEYDTGCEFEYVTLLKEQADAAAAEGARLTPLYRQPSPAAWQLVHECERIRDEVMLLQLTADERRALECARNACWIVSSTRISSDALRTEESARAITGLLERLK